jgi:hypothetical protein
MKLKKLAAVGVMVAALVVGTGAAALADTAPPANDPVRVWQDDTGWHVRVTHRSLHDRTFAGAVHTSGELVDVQGVKLERNDHLQVSSDGHTITFRFNNYGAIDGFDFNTANAPALKFGFLSDGRVVPARRIGIGGDGQHPSHDPFVIKLG